MPRLDNLNYEIEPKDLLKLPVSYLLKIREFLSTHSLRELDTMGFEKFVKEATGEDYNKVVKLVKIAKKKQSLEKDFV